MLRKINFGAVAIAVLLTAVACAPKPPPGYEQLGTEVKLNEIKVYYLGVREAYKAARAEKKPDGTPLMDDASFLLAVKADEAYSAAWNRYLDLRIKKQDTVTDLVVVAESLRTLQGIVSQFAPGIMDDAPQILNDLLKIT